MGLPTTLFVAVSITDTELLPLLTTYRSPFEASAAEVGPEPTVMGLPTGWFVVVLISVTVPPKVLVT